MMELLNQALPESVNLHFRWKGATRLEYGGRALAKRSTEYKVSLLAFC